MNAPLQKAPIPLPQLGAGEAFPDVNIQHELSDEMPGLVAVGGALDVATLKRAYSQGIFPWFSAGATDFVVEHRPAHGAEGGGF